MKLHHQKHVLIANAILKLKTQAMNLDQLFHLLSNGAKAFYLIALKAQSSHLIFLVQFSYYLEQIEEMVLLFHLDANDDTLNEFYESLQLLLSVLFHIQLQPFYMLLPLLHLILSFFYIVFAQIQLLDLLPIYHMEHVVLFLLLPYVWLVFLLNLPTEILFPLVHVLPVLLVEDFDVRFHTLYYLHALRHALHAISSFPTYLRSLNATSYFCLI
mmetsp:Transcript_6306/g.8062  ORF Transcript_6306/g.8062 Transcript_6306/m.8062 type:complete len:214 (+) Transcript_6306:141-782(+)